MPDPSNRDIADAFSELADLYELDGAIVHRVLAYRNAARAVRDAPTSVAALARAGRATTLPGIGKTLQEKVQALNETGTIPSLEKLRARYPPGLVDLTHIPGLGAKRARLLYETLGIDSREKLRAAAEGERLRTVKGLGPGFEERMLAALDAADEQPPEAHLLPAAQQIGEAIVEALRPHATDIALAGSIRRRADAVRDIDIAASAPDPRALAGRLHSLDLVQPGEDTASDTGARAHTHNGIRVELRVTTPDRFGNLLQHLTGSAAHNTQLRTRARARGIAVSEHGLDGAACATEQEVYSALGLPYIEPELREDRDELDAAQLPELITLDQIRGDLHCHTIASDGHNTIEQMAEAARERGYEYIAITDHSATHGFGNDVSPDELARQIERVREVDSRLEGIRVLAGSEVNILPDGALDYDDALLGELDWIVASVHTAFSMRSDTMTARMITAMEHPLVDAIGHPTGRLILRRAPYAIDLEAIIAAAARTGTLLEINANPDRRDLHGVNARAAASGGARIVIDSDAHRIATLQNMRFGVDTARRAWLTAADVANSRSWEDLQTLRKPARASVTQGARRE